MKTYRIVDMHSKGDSYKGLRRYRVERRHSLLFGLIHFWDKGADTLSPFYMFDDKNAATLSIALLNNEYKIVE